MWSTNRSLWTAYLVLSFAILFQNCGNGVSTTPLITATALMSWMGGFLMGKITLTTFLAFLYSSERFLHQKWKKFNFLG